MTQQPLAERIAMLRNERGLTQEELANQSELDVRTIQRIEKGEVKPYFSTLKLLSKALECDLIAEANNKPWQFSPGEIETYRKKFRSRRFIRIAIFIGTLALLLGVLTTFPDFELFGMAKKKWAPFFYLIMFGVLIAIGIIWRCPACKAHLASPFSSKYCPRCGLKFF